MTHTKQAIAYAKDVINKKINACVYIKQVCENFIVELAKKESLYYFDEKQANLVCSFIELLPHTKGEWALKRQKLKLEPWQKFIIANVFGWKRKKDDLRRYRRIYTEIPRKNGKSAISSGVGLYMMCLDKEFGAEVYSGATTEKQAWEVFRPARLMAKNTPQLVSAFKMTINAGSLVRDFDNSKFEPVIGNPGDGQSPSCAIIDELHEHIDDSLLVTMQTGMGSRKQPILWAITTAGFNISSPCYSMRQEVIDNLNGAIEDKELFGMIYTIDEDDDWTDPSILQKANPNCGISIYEDYLESQQVKAINNPRFANRFKTKHLNVWENAKANYFNAVDWKKCEDKTLRIEDFTQDELSVGIDLARKLDMNAIAYVFKREINGKIHYYSVAPMFFVPEDTIYSISSNLRRTVDSYKQWVNSGHLTATDGAEVDYLELLHTILDVNKTNPISYCAIDPHGATALSHRLAELELNPVIITQNYQQLSDPMKELEAAITSGRFHHDGNPIMTWCVLNVVGKHITGNDDVVRPVKDFTENKIDGAVALIMGISRLMRYEQKDLLSSIDETNIWDG